MGIPVVRASKKPIVLTGNGAASVAGTIPEDQRNSAYISVHNADLTQEVYVAIGAAGIAADATCQTVPAGQIRTFEKLPADVGIAIFFPGAGTKKVYFTPCGSNGIS